MKIAEMKKRMISAEKELKIAREVANTALDNYNEKVEKVHDLELDNQELRDYADSLREMVDENQGELRTLKDDVEILTNTKNSLTEHINSQQDRIMELSAAVNRNREIAEKHRDGKINAYREVIEIYDDLCIAINQASEGAGQ